MGLDGARVEGGWEHLPPTLCRLSIQYFFLHPAPDVPPELARLTALEHLQMVAGVPQAGWQHLHRLPRLSVAMMGKYAHSSATLPQSLSELTSLTALQACLGQPREQDWRHVAALSRLQRLDTAGSCMVTLPSVLSRLTALTALRIGPQQPEAGWEHLQALRLLRRLVMDAAMLVPVSVLRPGLCVCPDTSSAQEDAWLRDE